MDDTVEPIVVMLWSEARKGVAELARADRDGVAIAAAAVASATKVSAAAAAARRGILDNGVSCSKSRRLAYPAVNEDSDALGFLPDGVRPDSRANARMVCRAGACVGGGNEVRCVSGGRRWRWT